jgi:hypothetical protein
MKKAINEAHRFFKIVTRDFPEIHFILYIYFFCKQDPAFYPAQVCNLKKIILLQKLI